MSLCTLIPNQDKIKQYYQEIDDISHRYQSGWQVVGYIISEIIKIQWDLRRKYYNKNMLDKHKFEITIKNKEYLNCLFQHIYNHTHSSITDEIFEVIEARDKFFGINEEGIGYNLDNDEDYEKVLSLWIEELIDCLFFCVETTSWIETHYLLSLVSDNINNNTIEKYLIGYNEFSSRLSIMINEEGSHIATYIYDHKDLVKSPNVPNEMMPLIKINREFLRQTQWKDWKVFKDDYYNPGRFGEMFKKNREMYIVILNLLYNRMKSYATDIMKVRNYDAEHHISHLFKCIYAIFKTKAFVNEQRQLSDKRYTGVETHNNIQGVNV